PRRPGGPGGERLGGRDAHDHGRSARALDGAAHRGAGPALHAPGPVEVLPAGAVVLGHAEHCPVAVLRVGESMVGVQAHPEFPAAYVDALLADRVARIGDDEVATARASLAQPTDE